MGAKKNILPAIAVLVIAMLGVSVFWFWKMKNKPAEIASSAILAEEARKNYFEINDELAGVSFKIGKNFNRMPAQQLQMKNPNFIYGFFAKDDNSIACFISQTKREQGGQITVGKLRDGVLEQLKKSNPDANLDEAQIIDIGENNNKGAKLKMSYTEADKIPMIQWEIAGITDKTATFAFCASPKAVVELYEGDFNLFLDSVKIW